jgi:hypothetical protein
MHRSAAHEERNRTSRSRRMSEATRAKIAAERATIAANLLKEAVERNADLGRAFDDCL